MHTRKHKRSPSHKLKLRRRFPHSRRTPSLRPLAIRQPQYRRARRLDPRRSPPSHQQQHIRHRCHQRLPHPLLRRTRSTQPMHNHRLTVWGLPTHTRLHACTIRRHHRTHNACILARLLLRGRRRGRGTSPILHRSNTHTLTNRLCGRRTRSRAVLRLHEVYVTQKLG